jgi:phosphomannomutase/phosphoglucomutase
MINPLIFREYDIRGIADKDLTDDVVFSIGQGFGTYAQNVGVKETVVAGDVRLSTERIRKTLINGLLSTGCDVFDIGVIPTPVFYFSFFQYNKNSGIMITGSHNPSDFNGFKVGLNKTTIHGEEIKNLHKRIASKKFKQGRGKLSQLNPIPDYIKMIQNKVQIKSGLKVVFDPGNGTVGILLEELFRGLGVDTVFINLEPDGNFPAHLPDPTVPKYMKDLIGVVAEMHANIGIGYDGDGDRIGAVDENGNIVYGDKLLAIFARDIINKKPGAKIVFEVKCSQGIIEYIKSIGGTPLMWKTGHSLIKAKMKQEGALLAGEMSGHMFFADDYYGYDDAIFASVRLLKILSEASKPLSGLVAEIPYYYSTPEIRVDCPDEIKFKIVEEIKKHFQKKYETIDIDGVRVVFSDGWGLVRASNTQPVLVLRFEAKSNDRLSEIQKLFFEQLAKFNEVNLPNT